MVRSAGHTGAHGALSAAVLNEWMKGSPAIAPSHPLGPDVRDNSPSNGIRNWHKNVQLHKGDPGSDRDHDCLRAFIQGPPEPPFCNSFSHLLLSRFSRVQLCVTP